MVAELFTLDSAFIYPLFTVFNSIQEQKIIIENQIVEIDELKGQMKERQL